MRAFCIVLLTLALAACQGSRELPDSLAQPTDHVIRLSLEVSEAVDGNLICEVDAYSTQSIYQLSTRVLFDPLAVQPVNIVRGELVGHQAVFFALQNQHGLVPLAFTYHPEDSYTASTGTIAVLKFEVLDASRQPNIRFTEDSEFQISRDAGGRNMPLELVVSQ